MAGLALGCGADPAARNEPPVSVEDSAGWRLELEWTLAEGSEGTTCRYFSVPEGGFSVKKLAHELSAASHHLLLLRTGSSPEEAPEGAVPDCEQLTHESRGVIFGAQPGSGSVQFPDGVALALEAGEVLRLEHHAINGSEEPVQVSAKLELSPGEEDVTAEAGILHFYDWAIDVPPNGRAEAGMRCELPEAVELSFAHGHMHERGVRFVAWVERAQGPEVVLETSDWDAGTVQFDPPLRIEAGEALRFQCDYQNDEARRFLQGLSGKDDEMCSLTAGYHAESGTRIEKAAEGCALAGSGVWGSGELSCAELESCIDGQGPVVADDLAELLQRCWVSACPTVPIAFQDLWLCRGLSCAEECAVDWSLSGAVARDPASAACEACLEQWCSLPSSSCDSACWAP